LEPNFFAAAQALQADPNYGKLNPDLQLMVQTVVEHPERSLERSRIAEFLAADAESKESVLAAHSHQLAPLFKDIDAPGSLRKPGPSLRYADTKLDEAFLYDWISNPKNFRPSTRMPQVFGLHKHLVGSEEGLAVANKFEPIEIEGIATYIKQHSQKFEYLKRPEEVNAQPDAERGRVQFQTRGCLACHSHGEFAEAEGYRAAHEIVQGPDLSALAQKFDAQRNPKGRDWLYSWIKEPTRYHARTVMPNLYLDPIEVTDAAGKVEVTDPVDDIVEFLLTSQSQHEWKPKNPEPAKLDDKEQTALSELLYEHLKDAFSMRKAAEYAGGSLDAENKFVPDLAKPVGIPADRRDELKGAERDLVLGDGESTLTLQERMNYIGRKSISKYGCYGCHDIPGYEDAKPIGAGLNDWGRKEPAKLAFEHIVQYLEHGHHGGGHGPQKDSKHDVTPEEKRPGEQAEAGEHPADKAHANVEPGAQHAAHGHITGEHPAAEGHVPDFFMEQIFPGNRIGFLYQKLREPRSYDYHKT
jgi:cytochrome c2